MRTTEIALRIGANRTNIASRTLPICEKNKGDIHGTAQSQRGPDRSFGDA